MTLNPVLSIGTQMIEAVRAHDNVSREGARGRAAMRSLASASPSPEERLDAYPHQFSGGMRQRVAIATALLHSPPSSSPTSRRRRSTSRSRARSWPRCAASRTRPARPSSGSRHDLAVVSSLADDICVMYAGRIVETGAAGGRARGAAPSLHARAFSPSVPAAHEPGDAAAADPRLGTLAADLPPGCAFAPRCFKRADLPATTMPPLQHFATARTAPAITRSSLLHASRSPRHRPRIEALRAAPELGERIADLLRRRCRDRDRARGRRRQSRRRAGRDRRPRRRIRLRQVDARPHCRRASTRRATARRCSTQAPSRASRAGARTS